MKDFKIIFVHGYTASSKADWYPALLPQLDELHIDYVVPDLPGGINPHAQEWLDTIYKETQKTIKPLVLVGHSLGTRAVLLFLEKYQIPVEQVFLIAAFTNNTENAKRREEHYADFFTHEIDISQITSLAKKFLVLHSTDDNSIDYDQGVTIAKDLHAKLISFTDRKHFSEPSNAPYILEVLRKELHF